MRVVYVGNYGVPWTTETHVAASLEGLGHEVIRLQENPQVWDDLPIIARGGDADFVLWQHTHPLSPPEVDEQCLAALAELRASGIPSVSFHLDRYVGLEREHQIDDEPFWRTDIVVTADGGHDAVFAAKGVNHVWMPPAVYEGECAPNMPGVLRRQYRAAAAFMGSHPYPHPEWRPYRTAVIMHCRRALGGTFRTWPRGRAIRGQELNDFYASARVMVGDSCLVPDADGPCTRYWSDRIPETIGRGGFLIHPEVDGLAEHGFVDGETIVTYPLGDLDALVSLVRHYAADHDARRAISSAGLALVMERHTYAVRMRDVVALVAAWKEQRHAATRPASSSSAAPERVGVVVEAPPGSSTSAAPKKRAAKKAAPKPRKVTG